MENEVVDVLILNRNMREVTDELVEKIKEYTEVKQCLVVDAGSRESEVSRYTFVRDSSEKTIQLGLRPNKGFQLGLQKWVRSNNPAQWVLLLPNDSEIVQWNMSQLLVELASSKEIVAVVPIAPANPYKGMLPESRIAFGWNFHEGPLLLRRDFVEHRLNNQGYVLDPENFRGYLSFIELALQIFAANKGLVATDLISFSENQSHLLHNHHLIGTEPIAQNLELLIKEGEKWLAHKHGLEDRWSFEMLTRLAFEEFLQVNPELRFPALV
jgi:hypothetical protein